jgi:hypothetical protein
LEEGFFARGCGCVGGQFDFRGDTLLVQLLRQLNSHQVVRWGST